MVNGRLRLRSRKGGSHPRRVHAVSRAAAPKFSIIFWGAAGVLDWDVDAINGAAVAGLQIDGIGGAAGSFWFCEPGADPFSGVDRRGWWGPVKNAPPRGFDADGIRG